MRRATLPIFLVSSAGAVLASIVFLEAPATGGSPLPPLLAPPLVAGCILLTMGCLVVLATGRATRK